MTEEQEIKMRAMALELWDLFQARGLTYPEAIHLMASCAHLIGRKVGDEDAPMLLMIADMMKLRPELLEKIVDGILMPLTAPKP